MSDRLTEIEIRYTHLEHLIGELSGVVFEQQKAITGLERRLRDVEGRSQEGAEPTAIEKPPHY